MIKVLFVIDTLEVGGTEQSLLELVKRLDRHRFSPRVCHIYQGAALRAQFERTGVSVHSLNLRGGYRFLQGFQRLRELIREHNPDIVHTSLFRASQIGRLAGRALGVPVVSSFVNVPYAKERTRMLSWWNRQKLGALRVMDAATARFVSRFHSVSDAAKRLNCQHLHVASSRVSVIPRGRRLPGPRPTDEVLRCLRQRLDIAANAPLLVNIGRLVPQKGQHYLIKAMPVVRERHPAVRLVIAGDGPLRQDLETLIAKLGLTDVVQLVGTQDDVSELLHACDCFVFSSVYEGLPGSVIEAMLAACPIVASDIPMLDEILDSGATGVRVPGGDPAALAHAVCRVLEDRELARRIGSRAQAVAEQRFHIDAIVLQMQQFYEQVLAEVGKCRRAALLADRPG